VACVEISLQRPYMGAPSMTAEKRQVSVAPARCLETLLSQETERILASSPDGSEMFDVNYFLLTNIEPRDLNFFSTIAPTSAVI
jgi:hypothetical protein